MGRISKASIEQAREMFLAGARVADICTECGISEATFHRYRKERGWGSRNCGEVKRAKSKPKAKTCTMQPRVQRWFRCSECGCNVRVTGTRGETLSPKVCPICETKVNINENA